MKMKEKKNVSSIQLLLRLVVTDPSGKVLSDTGQKPSQSILIQWLEFFYGLFDGANVSATKVGGAEGPIYVNTADCGLQFLANAGVNVDTHGIVVGTGDTAVDNEDYELETQLTEGVGAGNITHGQQVFEAVAVVGANVDFETKRSFPNNTGSTITIKEAGKYTKYSTQYHCVIRDVLGTPVVLPDNCALTVYYTWRTTV